MGRSAGRIVNLDRSSWTLEDRSRIQSVEIKWRAEHRCPGVERRLIQRLYSCLWGYPPLRTALRNYRLAAELDRRRRQWRLVRSALPVFRRLSGEPILEQWSPALQSLAASFQGIDPTGAFPQPTNPPSRTQLRSALIRRAHQLLTKQAQGSVAVLAEDNPTAIAEMVADFLRASCPDICADVTTERVRRLMAYRKKSIRK